MTISTLVDLVVGRAQADGAVVVALLGRARRHLCGRGVNALLGCAVSGAVGPSVSPDFAASTRPAFFKTDANLPAAESGEPHRYRRAK